MTTRKSSHEKAQTTAEFVVILPFLLLFFFLVLDFGWLLKNWIVVTNSAREAARCAIVSDCGTAAGGGPRTPQELAELRILQGVTGNIAQSSVQVDLYYVNEDSLAGPTAGDALIVCVKGDNTYITP